MQLLRHIFIVLFVFTFLFIPNVGAEGEGEFSNVTDQIEININETDNLIELEYTIVETFRDPEYRHGIFISLPKNQGGVWTQYTVKSVKRSQQADPNVYFGGWEPPEDEKYEKIKEWDQLRIRIGDKDKNLEINTTHRYKIEIEVEKNKDYKYNFTVLSDWGDLVKDIYVYNNGAQVCDESFSCDPYSGIEITINDTISKTVPWYYSAVNTVWVYPLFIVPVYILLYILYLIFAKDPSRGHSHSSPEFEPPKGLKPWEAEYLISEGDISLKDTLLSYVLWLSNKQYVKIIAKTKTVKNIFGKKKQENFVELKKLKNLPKLDSLPSIFNEAIESIISSGFEVGLKSSKINPAEHEKDLRKQVGAKLEKFYNTKPLKNYKTFTLRVVIALVVLIVILSVILKSTILLGDSYIPVFIISGILCLPGLFLLFKKWAKLKTEFYKKRAEAVRYKYYIKKAEKYKLDFSNNPKDGVQYYLKAVPFAAMFAVLPKFNEYIQKTMPEIKQVNTNSTLLASYTSASFYAPPSSSGSSGFSSSGGGFSGGGGSW